MGGRRRTRPQHPNLSCLRCGSRPRDQRAENEFVEGRLSHETFVYRMQTAWTRVITVSWRTCSPTCLPAGPAAARSGPSCDSAAPWTPEPGSRSGAQVRRLRPFPGQSGLRTRPEPRVRLVPRVRAGRCAWPACPGARIGGQAGAAFLPPGRGDRFTIGRTRDCDLCLADLSVSRRHAELVRASALLLSDLGSHNGTRLNGWLVRETVRCEPGTAGVRSRYSSCRTTAGLTPGSSRVPRSWPGSRLRVTDRLSRTT